jgi:hypothetical protein
MLNFNGFLSSNFWTNYRCQSSASIEDLLNNKDCTVDKLLDDDDCIQEFKNYNDKLIKYFDHDKLKVLIDYITVMPSEADGHSRGHKYPFIAGEIFNCEINLIIDKFFEAPIMVKAAAASKADDDEKDEVDKDSDVSKDDSDVEKPVDENTAETDSDSKKEVKTAAAKNLEEAAATEKTEDDKSKEEEPTKDESETEKEVKAEKIDVAESKAVDEIENP